MPAPARSEFPAPDGRTLERIGSELGFTDEVVASPAGSIFRPGANRFGFGLFTVAREQIEDAEVGVYAAHGPTGKARGVLEDQGEEQREEVAQLEAA